MTTFIRTGEAADILGSSRQHVVNLIRRGDLLSYGPGRHRRLDRTEVEQLARGSLRREQRQSLWLHRAVAGRVAIDPDTSLERARLNIKHMRSAHRSDVPWLRQWETILDRGPEQVMRVLVSESQESAELRQNSPFAGVLTERQRSFALRAFKMAELRRAA